MSNNLEREILLFDQFKREQRSQETQKLFEFMKYNTRVAWAAMTKKQNIKTYCAVVVDEEEIWSADVVRVVFCSATQEIDRLRKAKSDEAFDLKLNLVRGSSITSSCFSNSLLGMRELRCS
jgi:preprotein translocase subunit SecD